MQQKYGKGGRMGKCCRRMIFSDKVALKEGRTSYFNKNLYLKTRKVAKEYDLFRCVGLQK